MGVKEFLFVGVVIFIINTTTAYPRRIDRRYQYSSECPPRSAYFSNVATPYPSVIENIDIIVNVGVDDCPCNNCNYDEAYYSKSRTKIGPRCKTCCNDQLILPPKAAELPYGLGYFPQAVPLVASAFCPAVDYLTTGAYIPVASPCDCMTLAAPMCPEWAPLVKPIIL